MALGTPIIAHAVGGLPNILKNRAGGILIANQDPDSYARAVAQLIQSDDMTIAELGLQRLQQCYSARHNANAVADLYQRISSPATPA
jgi:glycosyltransferase involved in cell wall biosynthesis